MDVRCEPQDVRLRQSEGDITVAARGRLRPYVFSVAPSDFNKTLRQA